MWTWGYSVGLEIYFRRRGTPACADSRPRGYRLGAVLLDHINLITLADLHEYWSLVFRAILGVYKKDA